MGSHKGGAGQKTSPNRKTVWIMNRWGCCEDWYELTCKQSFFYCMFYIITSEHEVRENMNLLLVLIYIFSFLVTGRLHGVAKQLQDAFPWLLPVGCAGHRLALACRDASSEVPYMATFREHLQQLHLYFHNSANRTAVLKAAAESLGLKDLKVKVRS